MPRLAEGPGGLAVLWFIDEADGLRPSLLRVQVLNSTVHKSGASLPRKYVSPSWHPCTGRLTAAWTCTGTNTADE